MHDPADRMLHYDEIYQTDSREDAVVARRPTGEQGTDNASPAKSPSRRSRLTPASEIVPEPIEWVWESDGDGRIAAGTLAIAAGREGTGKSSWAVWLGAQVSTGKLPGSLYGA